MYVGFSKNFRSTWEAANKWRALELMRVLSLPALTRLHLYKQTTYGKHSRAASRHNTHVLYAPAAGAIFVSVLTSTDFDWFQWFQRFQMISYKLIYDYTCIQSNFLQRIVWWFHIISVISVISLGFQTDYEW